jgi:hypothetical protein
VLTCRIDPRIVAETSIANLPVMTNQMSSGEDITAGQLLIIKRPVLMLRIPLPSHTAPNHNANESVSSHTAEESEDNDHVASHTADQNESGASHTADEEGSAA